MQWRNLTVIDALCVVCVFAYSMQHTAYVFGFLNGKYECSHEMAHTLSCNLVVGINSVRHVFIFFYHDMTLCQICNV